LFRGENPETIIFKFRKGKYNLQNEKIRLLNIKTRKASVQEIYEKAIKALNERTGNDLFDYTEIPHYLTSEPWSTLFFNTPGFPSRKLKEISKVGVGLVSGFDEAFILKEDEVLEGTFNEREMEIVKRFVKAKHCRRFIVEGYELYAVIDDTIKSEEELLKNYHNIYRKILEYKDRMSDRYLPGNKKWFHWQALRNYKFLLSNLNKKRIYVPTLDRHAYNRFSIGEDGGLLPSGDVIFIQPYKDDEDIYFLLGYLNSSFFRKYYLEKGGRRGGRVSFTQKLLENVEIPLFTADVKQKIAHITKEIISKLKEGRKEYEILQLEKRLDEFIYSAIQKGCFERNSKKFKEQVLF